MNKKQQINLIILLLALLVIPTIIAWVFNHVNVWLGFGAFLLFLYLIFQQVNKHFSEKNKR